jgi:excisionase family DNA binding protein
MSQQPHRDDRMLRERAAEYLGVSVATLAAWACKGKGPAYYKVGGSRVFYNRADLDAYLESCRVGAPAPVAK